MPGILSVVERAYHGTIEEQDDTILWVSHMLKNAGADLSVLLRSNAVNYAVKGQDASGLTIGGVELSVPPRLDDDVIALAKSGAPVYVVAEDLADRGISTLTRPVRGRADRLVRISPSCSTTTTPSGTGRKANNPISGSRNC